MISVIVPVFNSWETLEQVLEHLARQQMPPDQFEVIVVDDGSERSAKEALRRQQFPYALRIIRIPHRGPAAARNRGARSAAGSLLLFLDSDAIPSPWCLEAHHAMHLAHPRSVVQGTLLSRTGTTLFDRIRVEESFPSDREHGRTLDFLAISCNLSLRKLDFLRSGGFSEAFQYPCWEDIELGYRLMRSGLVLRYNREAIAFHWKPSSYVDALRNYYRRGREFIRLLAVQPGITAHEDLPTSRALRDIRRGAEEYQLPSLEEVKEIDRQREELEARASEDPSVWEEHLKAFYLKIFFATQCEGAYAELHGNPPTHEPARLMDPDPGRALYRIPVVWKAPFLQPSGYGEAARTACAALPANEVDLRSVSLPTAETMPQAEVPQCCQGVPSAEEPDWKTVIPSVAAVVHQMIPEHFAPIDSLYNIGVCTYETTRLPEGWSGRCNRMDEIWLPSGWSEEVFRNSGVAVPIAVIPYAVDPARFSPDLRTPRSGRRPFTFLAIGTFYPYKGFDCLLSAYWEEFDAGEPVRLVLKTYLPETPEGRALIGAEIARWRREVAKSRLPEVELVTGVLGIDELAGFFHEADAYVCTSRGEGFCLPLFQAAACGVPVIATGWGGYREYLSSDEALYAEYALVEVPANPHPFHRNGKWAEPSVPHLRALMRRVVEDPKGASEMAGRAARTVRERCSPEVVGRQMVGRLREIWGGNVPRGSAAPAASERTSGVSPGGRPGRPIEIPGGDPRVSIIIVTYDSLPFIRRLLRILPDTIAIPYECLVVDNGSGDGTREFLRSAPGIRLIELSTNTGFAHGCNVGAESARGEHLVFLNPDTEPTPGWCEALLGPLENDPSVGVVGAVLLYPDGTVQHAGLFPLPEETDYHMERGLAGNDLCLQEPVEVPAVTGACLAVSRSVFQECGGMEERYRNSYEDADLCLTLRSRGYRVMLAPSSVLVHHEGVSPGRFANDHRNHLLFERRWKGELDRIREEAFLRLSAAPENREIVSWLHRAREAVRRHFRWFEEAGRPEWTAFPSLFRVACLLSMFPEWMQFEPFVLKGDLPPSFALALKEAYPSVELFSDGGGTPLTARWMEWLGVVPIGAHEADAGKNGGGGGLVIVFSPEEVVDARRFSEHLNGAAPAKFLLLSFPNRLDLSGIRGVLTGEHIPNGECLTPMVLRARLEEAGYRIVRLEAHDVYPKSPEETSRRRRLIDYSKLLFGMSPPAWFGRDYFFAAASRCPEEKTR